eukprot:bmy_03539T0
MSCSHVALHPPLRAVLPWSGLNEARAGARQWQGSPRPEMVIFCAAVNYSNWQGKGEKHAVSCHRFPPKGLKMSDPVIKGCSEG